jgi:membrane associated rhomboid family serine protease
LLIEISIFLVQVQYNPVLVHWFALWPWVGDLPSGRLIEGIEVGAFQPWQLVTYVFLHGNLTHLVFNLFALWMFGIELEKGWGTRRFIIYFWVCGIGAALVQLVVATVAASQGHLYPTLGVSGAVFGILLAFCLRFPDRRFVLLFPPIPLRAKWIALGYAGVELWAGVTLGTEQIAHFAHLGGMVVGYLYLQLWPPAMQTG